MARLVRALLVLVVVGAFANVATASAAQPLEGQWREPSGRVLEFFATGPKSYSDRVVSGTSGSCNSSARNTELTGSGLNYSGTISFYRSSDCSPVGDGTMKVTVAADGKTAQIGYAQPSDQSCCSSQVDITRVSDPAFDAMPPGLAALVNGYLVQSQRYYAVVRKAGSKKRRTAVYKTIRAWASKRRTELVAYAPTDADEFKLQACAVKALGLLASAQAGSSKLVDGIHGLVNCLKPYRGLFPNGKPGSTPRKGDPAPPKAKPKRWNGWGTKGDAAYTFPRISFDVSDTAAGQAQLTNLDFAVRIICFNGGGGMLTNQLLPAMNRTVAPISSSRSFDFTYADSSDRFSFTIKGTFDKSFKTASGSLAIFGRDCKNFYGSFGAWPAP